MANQRARQEQIFWTVQDAIKADGLFHLHNPRLGRSTAYLDGLGNLHRFTGDTADSKALMGWLQSGLFVQGLDEDGNGRQVRSIAVAGFTNRLSTQNEQE